jgi:hypothetical protein
MWSSSAADFWSREFKSLHRLVIASSGPEAESLRWQAWDVEPAGGCDRQTKAEGNRRLTVNHSIYSADRSTHLKIVVVALVAAIGVAGFGIMARSNSDDYAQTARVIKAGKAVTITSTNSSVVR